MALSTAFRWRHRFLSSQEPSPTLTGIVEADETFVLLSYKGSRAWERAEQGRPGAEVPDREARGRGGKATKRGLSHEQVPILVAADRSGAVVSAVLPVDSAEAIKAVLDPVLSKDALLVTDGGTALACCAVGMKVSHEVMNQSAGERVRGELHIQTVNSLHERIKTFLRARRGVATKYLDNYLRWFHLSDPARSDTPRLPQCRHWTATQDGRTDLTLIEPKPMSIIARSGRCWYASSSAFSAEETGPTTL